MATERIEDAHYLAVKVGMSYNSHIFSFPYQNFYTPAFIAKHSMPGTVGLVYVYDRLLSEATFVSSYTDLHRNHSR